MPTKRVEEFLSGFIIIRVEGLNPEKFINMASRNKIRMWDLQKINYTTIELKMQYNQYPQLKGILKKTGCRARIVRKKGLHFVTIKVRKRLFFIAGIAIFLGLVLYLSSLVWFVEVTGNKKIDSGKILAVAEGAGLKKGRLKNSINLRDVENSILKGIEEISVVNIKMHGTRASVEVVERTMPPKRIAQDKPANIVAFKEGVVTEVLSYKGQSMVKEGDYVKKDQVLISGIVTDNMNVPLKIVHALGEVRAKTWYESIQEVSLNLKEEVRTGAEKQKVYINVMGKRLCIKNSKINFAKYDKIEEKTIIRMGKYETPVEKIIEHYFEKKYVYRRIDYEEAIKIGISRGEEDIKKNMPENIKILDKKTEKEIGNGKVKIRMLYIAEENIGIEQEIK